MTQRLWRSTKRRPLAERFNEKLDKRGPDDCWPWLGSLVDGYGQLKYEGRPVRASRISFLLANGYLPPVVRHKCDNPPCCNPAHLEPGTIADNHRDMQERGRTPRGATHWAWGRREHFEHGTIARYRQGCRCEPCKADNARAAREYRASRKAVSA